LQGLVLTVENFSLHITLKYLIDQKSKKDNVEFTAYQLAKAIGVPRSLITSLTHPKMSKRVTNPRISTLLKIVNFFRLDGFNITIENLLGITKEVEIQHEKINTLTEIASIPVYSIDDYSSISLGTINLPLKHKSKNLFALHSEYNIPPFFKAGSFFIIDQDLIPENENLIACSFTDMHKILIRKYILFKNKIYLRSLERNEKDILIMPTTPYKIIGVIIQVNAKI
jgi:transcriptional regulator with XRE-family HTH domain